MTAESWLKEFYPIPADAMRDASDVDLLEHCLRKWRGALPKNCKRHDVTYEEGCILPPTGAVVLVFEGDTCALCQAYDEDDPLGDFVLCPLRRHLGERCGGYGVYADSQNHPREMILALKDTLAMVRASRSRSVNAPLKTSKRKL